MEFNGVKKADLIAFAENNNVEVEDGDTVADIEAKLVEKELTKDDYEEFAKGSEESEEPETSDHTDDGSEGVTAPLNNDVKAGQAKSNQVLIRMTRNNASYSTTVGVFTKAHPFVVADEEDAQEFVKTHEGFHIADAGEAERFYA